MNPLSQAGWVWECLEADISPEKVQIVIGWMQGGKTTEGNGLLTKFYSQFGELLALKLTALFSDSTT